MYTSYFYFYSKIACINTDSVLRAVKGIVWSSSKYSGLDIFYGDFFCFARAVCERFTNSEPAALSSASSGNQSTQTDFFDVL